MSVFLVGAALAVLCEVDEYGVGPAIVRARGRTPVTARSAGIVASVEVVPGQRVTAGQLLARFDATAQTNELERTTAEYELQLMKMLRNPGDRAASEAMAAISAQKKLAEANFEDQNLRAPVNGVVNDVRLQRSQLVRAGDTTLTLTQEDAGFEVLAAVPGQYRPLVKPGASVRMELYGFPFAYQDLNVLSADTSVVGPGEVRRFLGQDVADAMEIEGPVFLVRSLLPGPGFTVDGRMYRYYDGMQGKIHARARRTRVVLLMFPWLRALRSDDT